MTASAALMAYVLAAGVLTLTPGVDTALVLRSVAADGRRAAAAAALGISVGLLLWGGLVAAGLGGLLAASAWAYAVLRGVGAAYLVFLGVRLLLKPRVAFGDAAPGEGGGNRSPHDAFLRGLGTNLLNPKIGVFYVTFLPQFVPSGAPVAVFTFLLAAIHALLVILWFTVLIAAATPLGRVLRRPRVARLLDRTTGVVFVAFGVRLALSKP